MTVDDLKSQLEDGLHEANVRMMLKTARALAKESDDPVPFYVVASIFGELDALWADQAVEAVQVQTAEIELSPALRQVIVCVTHTAPCEELLQAMDRLVGCFITLLDSGRLG